jgi:hypothetical protein
MAITSFEQPICQITVLVLLTGIEKNAYGIRANRQGAWTTEGGGLATPGSCSGNPQRPRPTQKIPLAGGYTAARHGGKVPAYWLITTNSGSRASGWVSMAVTSKPSWAIHRPLAPFLLYGRVRNAVQRPD